MSDSIRDANFDLGTIIEAVLDLYVKFFSYDFYIFGERVNIWAIILFGAFVALVLFIYHKMTD